MVIAAKKTAARPAARPSPGANRPMRATASTHAGGSLPRAAAQAMPDSSGLPCAATPTSPPSPAKPSMVRDSLASRRCRRMSIISDDMVADHPPTRRGARGTDRG